MSQVNFGGRLALNGPVGNGMDNQPNDVLAIKRRLNRLGLYDEPPYGFTGYIDRDTELGIRKFQKNRGLKVDGYLMPGGETEQTLNGDGLGIVAGDQSSARWPFTIGGDVGNGRDNREHDVVSVKRAFGALGRYPLGAETTPFIDKPLSTAIRDFQAERGLKQTGAITPGDETAQALRTELESSANSDPQAILARAEMPQGRIPPGANALLRPAARAAAPIVGRIAGAAAATAFPVLGAGLIGLSLLDEDLFKNPKTAADRPRFGNPGRKMAEGAAQAGLTEDWDRDDEPEFEDGFAGTPDEAEARLLARNHFPDWSMATVAKASCPPIGKRQSVFSATTSERSCSGPTGAALALPKQKRPTTSSFRNASAFLRKSCRN